MTGLDTAGRLALLSLLRQWPHRSSRMGCSPAWGWETPEACSANASYAYEISGKLPAYYNQAHTCAKLISQLSVLNSSLYILFVKDVPLNLSPHGNAYHLFSVFY